MKKLIISSVVFAAVACVTPAVHADDEPPQPPVLEAATADCHNLSFTISGLVPGDFVSEELGSAPPGLIYPDADGIASNTFHVNFADTIPAADLLVVRRSTHEHWVLFHQDLDCTQDAQVIPMELNPPEPAPILSVPPRPSTALVVAHVADRLLRFGLR